jgi:hypothetical protein
MVYIADQASKFIDKSTDFVVMDGANAGAIRLLMDKHPWLSGVVCTTHSLNLLMEDIGKLECAVVPLQDLRKVISFVRNHHATKSMWASRCKLSLLLPGATRFGTQFIMIDRVLRPEVKSALRELFFSEEYQKWLSGLSGDDKKNAR